MKFYKDWLQQNEYTVNYIETEVKENDCRLLVASLAKFQNMYGLQQGIYNSLHRTRPKPILLSVLKSLVI